MSIKTPDLPGSMLIYQEGQSMDYANIAMENPL